MVERKKIAEVSLGGIRTEKDLPFPVVHYPNHYGAFFGFSKTDKGEVFLCECNRSAFINLIEINKKFPSAGNTDELRDTPVDNFYAPDILAKISSAKNFNTIDKFKFSSDLCHRCNMTPPTMSYCHKMYGGQFVQSFGWYVQQAYFRLGIKPLSFEYLEDVCPTEYQIMISEVRESLEEYHIEYDKAYINHDNRTNQPHDVTSFFNYYKHKESDLSKLLKKRHNKLKNKLKNSVENIVRQEFGFKKVGEGWVSETLLFQIINRLLPNREIIRHHRPEWLDGLELDIYVPTLALGLEYQGQQHYKSVPIWGGEVALAAQQERDARKKRICRKQNITFLEVKYTEPLTIDHISKRLSEVNIYREQ